MELSLYDPFFQDSKEVIKFLKEKEKLYCWDTKIIKSYKRPPVTSFKTSRRIDLKLGPKMKFVNMLE